MRKTKEVLRLRFGQGLGLRQIARSCSLSLGTIHDYLRRAKAGGISWPLPEGWDEEKLEAALFGATQPRPTDPDKAAPDFAAIHEQKQRHRHVTLQLPRRSCRFPWAAPSRTVARMPGNVAEGTSVHIQSGQENRRVVTGNLRVTGSPASAESPTSRLFGNLLALVGSEEARSVALALASR